MQLDAEVLMPQGMGRPIDRTKPYCVSVPNYFERGILPV
jgi:hypothetical protein